jgi:hypothetical protein
MYLPRQNETILPVVCVLPRRRWEDNIKKDSSGSGVWGYKT